MTAGVGQLARRTVSALPIALAVALTAPAVAQADTLKSASPAMATGHAIAEPPDRPSPPDPLVLDLWNGVGPGSEGWSVPERMILNPDGAVLGYANVSRPTVSVYLPDPSRANGAAIVILPGGGLRMLGWDGSVRLAEWLNAQGVAAIILKYRTLQMSSEPAAGVRAPGLPVDLVIRNGNANPDPSNAALNEVLAMGVADAGSAMRLVRSHAATWRIDPVRVGMLGMSAGGGVAIGATLSADTALHPDFLVSVYGPSLIDVGVPDDAPPLFIVVGADHQPVANGLIALHQLWKAAGKSSELHIYDQVTGPFPIMTGGRAPVDHWPDLMLAWLNAHHLVNAPGAAP